MVSATRAAAVLVAALACVAVARASALWDDDDSSNCGDFDFFVFTRQWPAGNGCTDNCQNAFTIHGMWPSNTNGNDPSYCGAKFVASELDPIMSQLQKQWPSYQGQDDSFWSHEFEKHGSCACSLPTMKTEFDFFNTTLAWHNQYNLMDALNKAGISPGGSVSVDSLVQAVEGMYGGGATVQCSSGKLESIEMCLDKQFNTMRCPSGAMQGTCTSSSVDFPSSN